MAKPGCCSMLWNGACGWSSGGSLSPPRGVGWGSRQPELAVASLWD